MIRIVAENWPELLAHFELKGVLMSNPDFNDQQRHELRRSGVDIPLVIDGRPYFSPGGGLTSASTPGKVTESMFRLKRNLRILAQCVLDPNDQFLATVPESDRAKSHFSLILSPRGVVIFERITDRGWTFPEVKMDGTDSVFSEVSDCLTPAWVKDALIKGDL